MKRFINSSGLTALELIVAMTLSAVVISGAYKAQVGFNKAASRENDKALLQRDIISVCDMLEKDIRMAGLGLPGNGVNLILNDTTSDQLCIFMNKDQIRTNLSQDVSISDPKILVNPGISKWGGWVCLQGNATVFREISRIGRSFSGNPDTIYLNGTVNAGPFSTTSTVVHSADRVSYLLKPGTGKALVRKFNKREALISSEIDSLSITPKDNNGSPLGSGTAARVITAVVGGYIGQDKNLHFLAESTEVNIRNVY